MDDPLPVEASTTEAPSSSPEVKSVTPGRAPGKGWNQPGWKGCTHQMPTGELCQTPVLQTGKDKGKFCLWHSKKYSKEKAIKGGERSHKKSYSHLNHLVDFDEPLDNLQDIKRLLGAMIAEMRMAGDPARDIAAVVSAFLKSYELIRDDEVKADLEEIKKRMGIVDGRGMVGEYGLEEDEAEPAS